MMSATVPRETRWPRGLSGTEAAAYVGLGITFFGEKVAEGHGLRKLIETRLAEAGASENAISAILAWRDNWQAAYYTKSSNKKKLADLGAKQLAKDGR
jgi:hypothetical protein